MRGFLYINYTGTTGKRREKEGMKADERFSIYKLHRNNGKEKGKREVETTKGKGV